MHVSEITFIRYAQSRKIGESQIISSFESNKTKGPTQSQLSITGFHEYKLNVFIKISRTRVYVYK